MVLVAFQEVVERRAGALEGEAVVALELEGVQEPHAEAAA